MTNLRGHSMKKAIRTGLVALVAGLPPGEFTPPGMIRLALSNQSDIYLSHPFLAIGLAK